MKYNKPNNPSYKENRFGYVRRILPWLFKRECNNCNMLIIREHVYEVCLKHSPRCTIRNYCTDCAPNIEAAWGLANHIHPRPIIDVLPQKGK